MPGDDSMEDEWEYEYDEIETESFYINLDLTSCNGVIRPPRVRLSSAANSKTRSTTTQEPTPSGDSPPLSPPDEQFDDDDLQVPDPEMAPQDEIQIMDLHTRNPIISYQNQIFSCSWADMIGTELLFSHPEGHSNLPTLRRNEEYDLISANRVKIIGKKGTLVASSLEGTEPVNDSPAAEQENPGVPAAGEASTLVPANQPPKRQLTNQARFIERLMNAKRARGENDVVRTVFSQKQSEEFQSRLRGWAKTQEQMAEYERLNRRVLQGDPDAQVALEEIYEKMERESAAADDGMEEDSQPGPSHSHRNTTGINETEDRNGNGNSNTIT